MSNRFYSLALTLITTVMATAQSDATVVPETGNIRLSVPVQRVHAQPIRPTEGQARDFSIFGHSARGTLNTNRYLSNSTYTFPVTGLPNLRISITPQGITARDISPRDLNGHKSLLADTCRINLFGSPEEKAEFWGDYVPSTGIFEKTLTASVDDLNLGAGCLLLAVGQMDLSCKKLAYIRDENDSSPFALLATAGSVVITATNPESVIQSIVLSRNLTNTFCPFDYNGKSLAIYGIAGSFSGVPIDGKSLDLYGVSDLTFTVNMQAIRNLIGPVEDTAA